MDKARTSGDLDLYAGSFKTFEWYWNASGQMPGLEGYEHLGPADRAGILSAFAHWGNLAPGGRPLESRVNKEHDEPLIVCAKFQAHRFPAFHAGHDVWIVTG